MSNFDNTNKGALFTNNQKGNEKTEYFVLSVRAAAIPARSVEMAAISPPLIADQDKVQASRVHVRGVCCPFYKVTADSHRS